MIQTIFYSLGVIATIVAFVFIIYEDSHYILAFRSMALVALVAILFVVGYFS